VIFTTRKYDKHNRIISSENNLGMVYLYKYSDKNTETIIINSKGKDRIPFISYKRMEENGSSKRVEVSDIYFEVIDREGESSKTVRYNMNKETCYKKFIDSLEKGKLLKTETYRDREGKIQKEVSFSVGEHIINFK